MRQPTYFSQCNESLFPIFIGRKLYVIIVRKVHTNDAI